MAQRTSRRRIRDKLDAAATLVQRAEGTLSEVVALYYERANTDGYLIETMRESLETIAALIRDYRATRS
jgi:hypothetical protein